MLQHFHLYFEAVICLNWCFFIFDGHMSILGPLIPLFWTSDGISSRFQIQSGQPYSHLTVACTIYIP